MSKPFFNIEFSEKIEYVCLSPHEWSQNLICLAFKEKIEIGILKFQEEYDDLDQEIEYEFVEDFYNNPRVHSISWNPSSSLNKLPKTIELCSAGSDFSLRFFQSNLTKDVHTRKQLIEAHNDYINECLYDPDGDYLASVSDDCTCKLWCANSYVLLNTFNLTSPGMSVAWHPVEVSKLLVGEKNGVVRIYNVMTHQAIGSHNCYSVPLISISWSLVSKYIAVLTAGELIVMDMSIPSHILESKVVHTGGGYKVAFCNANENYVATAGKPNNSLKISHIRSRQIVLSTNLQTLSGFSWHQRLPYLCVASNNKLSFFKISPK